MSDVEWEGRRRSISSSFSNSLSFPLSKVVYKKSIRAAAAEIVKWLWTSQLMIDFSQKTNN
jgi:hypothetical protein